jgi:hypothetical protein
MKKMWLEHTCTPLLIMRGCLRGRKTKSRWICSSNTFKKREIKIVLYRPDWLEQRPQISRCGFGTARIFHTS